MADEFGGIPVDPGTDEFGGIAVETKKKGFGEQLKKEVGSIKGAGDVGTILSKGLVGGTLGAPVDLINMGLQGADYVANKLTGAIRPEALKYLPKLSSEAPVGGSEWINKQMSNAGVIGKEERPILETGASLLPVAPAAAKCAVKLGKAAVNVAKETREFIGDVIKGAVKPKTAPSSTIPVTESYYSPEGVRAFEASPGTSADLAALEKTAKPVSDMSLMDRTLLKFAGNEVPATGQVGEALGQGIAQQITDPLKLGLNVLTGGAYAGITKPAQLLSQAYLAKKMPMSPTFLDKLRNAPKNTFNEHFAEVSPQELATQAIKGADTAPAAEAVADQKLLKPAIPQLEWNGGQTLAGGGGVTVGRPSADYIARPQVPTLPVEKGAQQFRPVSGPVVPKGYEGPLHNIAANPDVPRIGQQQLATELEQQLQPRALPGAVDANSQAKATALMNAQPENKKFITELFDRAARIENKTRKEDLKEAVKPPTQRKGKQADIFEMVSPVEPKTNKLMSADEANSIRTMSHMKQEPYDIKWEDSRGKITEFARNRENGYSVSRSIETPDGQHIYEQYVNGELVKKQKAVKGGWKDIKETE